MLGTSPWEYVFIRASIFALRLVTPTCACYTVAYIIRPFRFPGAPLLYAYSILETGFYLLVYLPRTLSLQSPAKHPKRIERERRRELFARCCEEIPDPRRYLRK